MTRARAKKLISFTEELCFLLNLCHKKHFDLICSPKVELEDKVFDEKSQNNTEVDVVTLCLVLKLEHESGNFVGFEFPSILLLTGN